MGNLSFYSCANPKASRIFEKKLGQLVAVEKQAKRLQGGIREVCKDAASSKKMVCLMSYMLKVNFPDRAVSELLTLLRVLKVQNGCLDYSLFIDVFSKAVLLSKAVPESFVVVRCFSLDSTLCLKPSHFIIYFPSLVAQFVETSCLSETLAFIAAATVTIR